MTIANTNSKDVYTVDGSSVFEFVFTFDSVEESDLKVELYDEDNELVGSVLTYVSSSPGEGQFTVDLDAGTITVGKDGAEATLQDVYGDDVTQLVVYREIDLTQETNLPTGERFPVAAINERFDITVLQIQQIKEITDRCLQFHITESPTDPIEITEPAADRALKFLAFDSAGDPVMSSGSSDVDIAFEVQHDATGLHVDITAKGPWYDPKAYGAEGDGATDDSSAFADARTAAAGAAVRVTKPDVSYAIAAWPPIPLTDHVSYLYDHWAASDPILEVDGTRGGWFADWDLESARQFIVQTDEDLTTIGGATGSFRDALFIQMQDVDAVNYTAIGQRVTHGLRVYTTGRYTAGAWVEQYKDLVGALFVAQGRVEWGSRGVSAITAEAIQEGIGICSNEFAVYNPSTAENICASMAALQLIVKSQKTTDPTACVSRGLYINALGHDVTYGIHMLTDTDGATKTSRFKFGLDMRDAVIRSDGAAIRMGTSQGNNSASIIEYEANNYTDYVVASNTFRFVAESVVALQVSPTSITQNAADVHTVGALADEATPSVEGLSVCATGGTTTITDFDDGVAGQILTVLCAHSLTFDFTTAQDADHNLDGSSADITADAGDILRFLNTDGTTWQLVSNNDASADNN